MTLADELRGITPHITITGRMVMQPDVPLDVYRPDLSRGEALREWIKQSEPFTFQDVMDAIGITKSNASQYMTRLYRSGEIRKVGERLMGRKYAAIYEANPEPLTAAEKHFG